MEQALVEYLLNALWQLPLLVGSAWLLLRLLRPTPQTQHGVWLAVLALAVALPLYRVRQAPPLSAQHLTVAAVPAPGLPRSLHLGPGPTRWVVRLYLVSVGIGLLRIAWAWRTAKQLVDHSRATCLGSQTMAAFEAYGQRLGIKLPQLRKSPAVSTPMVVGLRNVALLLPDGFARHTASEMRAALCHELAHVERRDYLVNLVCEVAALPITWHPATHQLLQRIRVTREMVCDAMAAQEINSQLGYAKCLLALAHSMLGGHGIWLGLFSKHTLEERVMQLAGNYHHECTGEGSAGRRWARGDDRDRCDRNHVSCHSHHGAGNHCEPAFGLHPCPGISAQTGSRGTPRAKDEKSEKCASADGKSNANVEQRGIPCAHARRTTADEIPE